MPLTESMILSKFFDLLSSGYPIKIKKNSAARAVVTIKEFISI